MAHRKKTLRQMPERTRRVAKCVDEGMNALRRLKAMLPELQTVELIANAESKRQTTQREQTLFSLSQADLRMVANRKGVPMSALTTDVIDAVKTGLGFGLECWEEVMGTALDEALEREARSVPETPEKSGDCPKCGQHWIVHESDGSCVKD